MAVIGMSLKVDEIEEVVAVRMGELVTVEVEEVMAGELEEVVAGEVEEVVTGLGDGLDEMSVYDIQAQEEIAAMKKRQKMTTEGGWMRCASCGVWGKGEPEVRGLECHVKDWGEGHRARCRQIRKEFVEIILDPLDTDKSKVPLSYFTVQIQVSSQDSEILVYSKDDSVFGDLLRPGQGEVYDEVKKVVEEQGYEQELDETGYNPGTLVNESVACFFAHYKVKNEA